MSNQPTKSALAKAAGVSTTSVNRYLAGSASAETATAIEEAATAIGYNLSSAAAYAPEAPEGIPQPALPEVAKVAVKANEQSDTKGTLEDGRTYEVVDVHASGKPRLTPLHTHTLIIRRPIVGGANETKHALDHAPTFNEIKRIAN